MGIRKLKNYIDGNWIDGSGREIIEVENPATGEILAQFYTSTRDDVKNAVEAAKKAFYKWRDVPAVERCRYMFRFCDLMKKNWEELAKDLTREHGKEYPAAYGEMRRSIEMVEVACGIPSLMKGEYSENVAKGIDEYMIRVPLGVFAVIPPFNFPAMIAMWFLPWAVATGNTYIVKPAREVPITMQNIFKLIEEAGFPEGVVNLVHSGEGVNGELLENKDIVGISSVTSTETAKKIYTKAIANGKRAQCSGGAINFAIFMPDAELDKAIPNVIESCFGNTGQRCLHNTFIIGVGDVYKEVKEKFVDAASKLKIGYGLDEGVQLTPVVSRSNLDKLHRQIEICIKEGIKLIKDGRDIKVEKYPKGYFLGPTIFEEPQIGSYPFREEIFGPVVFLKRAKDLDDAINIANSVSFGNASTIYTNNGKWAREYRYRIKAGNIGINVGIAAPMAFYQFAGMKDSFFGDLHPQANDVIEFFTDKKIIISRWY